MGPNLAAQCLGSVLSAEARDARDPAAAAAHLAEALFYLTLRYLSGTQGSGSEDQAALELLDAADVGHQVVWRRCPGWKAKVRADARLGARRGMRS